MGLTPLMLFTVRLLAVRNQRILTAWDARQEDNASAAPPKGCPRKPAGAPQDARRAHIRRTALTGRTPEPPAPARTPRQREHAGTPKNQARNGKRAPPAPSEPPGPSRTTDPPGMSDPNVKIGPHET